MLRKLCRFHDEITRYGFIAGVVCVAVMAMSFCYEVVARYFFNAPTDWASPLVSYLLCMTIFLAAPELTRQAAHVSITVVIEQLKGRNAVAVSVLIHLLAAAACLLAAWFSIDATLEQYEQGIWTNPPLAVPKWVISSVIPYAMLSAAVYFLRQLRVGQVREGPQVEQL